MTVDLFWPSSDLSLDVQHGFLDSSTSAPRVRHPKVVINEGTETALRALNEQLARSETFQFSVAFVTSNAIAALKQQLIDYKGQGTIITSTYLGFNAPSVFRELLVLQEHGIDVRLHTAHGFHPKGYVFEAGDVITAMVGSSNLTSTALQQNHEWNLKVSASAESSLGHQFRQIMQSQLAKSVPLTQKWVEDYEANYTPPSYGGGKSAPVPDALDATAPPLELLDGGGEPSPANSIVLPDGHIPSAAAITPNAMQAAALDAIAKVRDAGETRAIIISATGTGKTILSALEVQAAAPNRMLFIVHREQILDKTISEYRRVLGGPVSDYGKLAGSTKQADRRYVFATVQTLSMDGVLDSLETDAFDYIVLDEAHRAAAASHQKVLNHFKPDFLLAMTATPERMDGKNIFEIFDYNVPYEIRLNHALEEGMLAPFHYYGVADVEYDDGTTTDASTTLSRLISAERVSHLLGALHTYGQAGIQPRGLIFCSRNEEAATLSAALNDSVLRGRRLRTAALTGKDSVETREHVVQRLERGELDYILTVDIFNEGVDIPSINQVVMLRQTQSAIVFVQQLGRGLRLSPGKEYLVVIDFIGNYANNYLIPIALFGDESLSKESLRKNLISAEEQGSLPGLSSVHFDKISQERILKSIVDAKMMSASNIKAAMVQMRNRVGGVPALWDFYRFEATDPVILATFRRHYLELAEAMLKSSSGLTPTEGDALTLLSHEVLTARRTHEFVVLEALLDGQTWSLEALGKLCADAGLETSADRVDSVIDTFTLARHSDVDKKRYKRPIAEITADEVRLTRDFRDSYASSESFARAVDDVVRTGKALTLERYLPDRPFTPGVQYGRKETMRLLHLPRKWTAAVFGYKADPQRRVCPIFVTLHKTDEVSASTAYEDAILDRNNMVWFTRSKKTVHSELEASIIANEYSLPVFVKKSDAEGIDFYYLGDATVAQAEQSSMKDGTGKDIPVVKTLLNFAEPIDRALFDYLHPTVTA